MGIEMNDNAKLQTQIDALKTKIEILKNSVIFMSILVGLLIALAL